MKTQRERSGGRILLGDSTGGKAVMLRPIGFQYAGVWIAVGLQCVYMIRSDLSQNPTCAGPSRTWLLCKPGCVCNAHITFVMAYWSVAWYFSASVNDFTVLFLYYSARCGYS
jgi:hypothetical protein